MKHLLLSCVLVLLCAAPSWAVIAEVASRKTQIGSTTNVDSQAQGFTGTPATGELLVVMGVADSTNSSIGVSDNRGNSYTVQTYAVGVYRAFIAYAFAGSTNTVQVTVNPSPTNCKITFTLDSFSGVHATVPLDVALAGNSGTGTAPTVSITPTVNGTIALGFETHAGTNVVQDVPAGWTQMGEVNNVAGTGIAGNSAFLINTTTATLTPTWTFDSSQSWIAIVAVLKAADSTVPSVSTFRHRIYSGE